MRRLGLMLPALLLVTAGACGEDPPGTSGADTGSGPGGTTRQSSAVPFTNWPTYHRNGARTGLTAPAVRPPLQQTWQDQLRGAVYGEPLVLGSSLVVATERNDVFGLDARTGKHRWRAHLGSPAPLNSLPCGNIDPLGITGTPAYDRATGSVFVVAETVGGHHTLWALNATTGARKWHRRLDVLPERNQLAQQERSALLVTGGRVITTFGGLAGDCDNYVGYVTSIATTGAGPVRHYAVPTAREAGMWSPAGPVVGANGNVYVSSGNGAELHGVWDKSDSVTELTPTLLRRLAIFAPSTWRDDNVRDLDLGSSSPAPVAAAGRIVIAGKRGTVYLLRPELGGVGSEVAHLDGCTAFGGAAVAGSVVLMPCLGEGSVRALVVGSRSLRWSWTADVYASPVIAGKLAYVADRDSGDLVVLSLATGEELDRIHAGELTHFPSQVVDGGMVFVPTLTGVTAFTGS